MGERRGVYGVFMGKPEGKNKLEDPGVGGKVILKWISRTLSGGHELDRNGFR